MISQVAIRKDGKVWTLPRPARHQQVMELGGLHGSADGTSVLRYALADGEQGFVTDEGVFLGRIEAAKHAELSGQIQLRPSVSGHSIGWLNHPPNLYSEDLW